MCDGKPYLCSTCHNRFDCVKVENIFYFAYLHDVPQQGLQRITLEFTESEIKLGEYKNERNKEKREKEEIDEYESAKAFYEAEMYEMD